MCSYSLCPNGRPDSMVMLRITVKGEKYTYCSIGCARADLETMRCDDE